VCVWRGVALSVAFRRSYRLFLAMASIVWARWARLGQILGL